MHVSAIFFDFSLKSRKNNEEPINRIFPTQNNKQVLHRRDNAWGNSRAYKTKKKHEGIIASCWEGKLLYVDPSRLGERGNGETGEVERSGDHGA